MDYTFTITLTDAIIWRFIIIGSIVGITYAYLLYEPIRWMNQLPIVTTTIGVATVLALLWIVAGFPIDFVFFLTGAFAVVGGIPNFIRMVFELRRAGRLSELIAARDQQR